MRPFTHTLPFADALRLVLDAAVPVTREESVALREASERVVARDVSATVDVPAFDRAAMDGYAVVAADTAGARPTAPAVLTCVERLFTGQLPSRPVTAGSCVEIATGAPMPAGADAVVMVEQTARTGDDVSVYAQAAAGQNIGRRAADLRAGQTVVRRGDALSPARIGALAAVGLTHVPVFGRPSVAIMSTGNEVVPPGQPLEPGQVYDVNRFTIDAVVRRHGGVTETLAPVGDTIDALSSALESARAHDIVVFSGGSSVGDRDLMRDVLSRHGEIVFHGISVKPGKPTLFGRCGRVLVFGMPGYPTSCLSNAYMLLLPLVRAMAHLPPWRPHTVDLLLARKIASTGDRHQFYTVRIANGEAHPAFKASGDITSMANADGYIEIPVGTETVPAGTVVTINLF